MARIKKQLDLIFPGEQVREPVIYRVSREYDIVFNIRRAKVTETTGELALEFEGEESEVEKAVEYLAGKGVKVQPLPHDIVE